jgi:hypothetical protein
MFGHTRTEYDFSAWNWLYGSKVERFPGQEDGPVRVRSVVLDMDTVLEIGAILKNWAGADPVFVVSGSGQYANGEVPATKLNSLAAEDRTRLIVSVHRNDLIPPAAGSVTFHNNPTVNVSSHEVRDLIVEKLLNNRPRIKWKLVARLIPLVLPLARTATVSVHGTWKALSKECKGATAHITVQLQRRNAESVGDWKNVGSKGTNKRAYSGGGSNNRANARYTCHGKDAYEFRAVVKVGLNAPWADNGTTTTTPFTRFTCGAG